MKKKCPKRTVLEELKIERKRLQDLAGNLIDARLIGLPRIIETSFSVSRDSIREILRKDLELGELYLQREIRENRPRDANAYLTGEIMARTHGYAITGAGCRDIILCSRSIQYYKIIREGT